MDFKNTENGYGLIAKLFHWFAALIILGLLILGFYMEAMPRGPDKFELYGIHKSFGVIVLALMALRIVWRFISPAPPSLTSHKTWEKLLAKSVQGLLYLTFLALPLSGWVMSSAGGHPVSLFGVVKLPAIVEKNEAIGKIAHEAHEILPLIGLGLLVLHIAGAFKHHFLDRDDTLRRMTSPKLLGLRAVIMPLVWGSLFAAALAAPFVADMLFEAAPPEMPPE